MKKIVIVLITLIIILYSTNVIAEVIYFKGAMDTPFTEEVAITILDYVDKTDFNSLKTYKSAIIALNLDVLHGLTSLKTKLDRYYIDSSKYSIETKTLRCSFKIMGTDNIERRITIFVQGVPYGK